MMATEADDFGGIAIGGCHLEMMRIAKASGSLNDPHLACFGHRSETVVSFLTTASLWAASFVTSICGAPNAMPWADRALAASTTAIV